MKTNLYRLISVSLATLVLLTSLDYTVDMHFCQGDLKSYSIFGKAKMCYMGDTAKQSCVHKDRTHQKTLRKKSCCSSKTFHAKLVQNQVTSNQAGIFKTIISPMAVLPLQAVVDLPLLRSNLNHWTYRPPPLLLDIFSLLQVFRL
ncbi:MAG: hypothetical protein KDC53_08435 [Saprospiraceae bacterium]|nr:hypothetical protein [Saprospiraceae bacterium]